MSLGDYYRTGASVGVTASVGDILGVATITPSRFRQDMDRTAAYIDALARDVNSRAADLSAQWKAAWRDFILRWGAFVVDHPSGAWSDAWASATAGPWNRINAFANEARTWRVSLDSGSTAPPDIAPSPPTLLGPLAPQSSGPSLFMWGLLGIGAIVAVAYMRRSG